MGIRTRETTEYFPRVKNCEQTSTVIPANISEDVIVPNEVQNQALIGIEESSEVGKEEGGKKVANSTSGKSKGKKVSANGNGSGNKSRNGIIKTSKKLKRGMRIMMERTNKLLEKSKNCKKAKAMKPRIPPARASARLCVRKSSGESNSDQGCGEEPLRTVELIQRPLELREPGTKLLFLASLGLYPMLDPEDPEETTPIVIIEVEVTSPGGKKGKLRNMELPLMPNWRNRHSHIEDRPAEDSLLLQIAPISAKRSCSPPSDKPPEQPTVKTTQRKSPSPPIRSQSKSPPAIKEAKVSKTSTPEKPITKETKSSKTATPEKPIMKETKSSKTTTPEKPIMKETKSSKTTTPEKPIMKETKSSKATTQEKDTTKGTKSEQKTILKSVSQSILPTPVDSSSVTLAQPAETSKLAYEPTKKKTTSGLKKRKSLETIIREIPKAKSESATLPLRIDVKSDEQNGNFSYPAQEPQRSQLPQPTSQSSNPILEELMKKPVNKKRAPKRKRPTDETQASNIQIPNPISMTVPLQPAPGLPINIGTGGSSFTKEAPKSRSKKPKPSFQLPMPLPIPLPPGLLNYASLLPNNELTMTVKSKKQRKPRVKKPKEIIPMPQNNTNTTNLSMVQQPNQYPSIPYLPSHLEAFFKIPPILKMSDSTSLPPVPIIKAPEVDVALDLCMKARVSDHKKVKKAHKEISAPQSILKPLSAMEDDTPLNLVMNRPEINIKLASNLIEKEKMSEPLKTLPDNVTATSGLIKPQGGLDNVKQMLARLHTKIAPAVNGVQLITIE